MDDLISRQAAIDAIRASTSKYTGFMEMEMYTDDDAVEAINGVPSAQPEQKKGKWIEREDPIISATCSCCGWDAILFETDVAGMPYCPNCGAEMEGEEDDAKIH